MFSTCFPRQVLKMIGAHKDLITRCAPLAKMVVEMLAVKNWTKDPLPDIWLPVQLLLETLCGRILDMSKASAPVPVRTTGWWGTFFCSAEAGVWLFKHGSCRDLQQEGGLNRRKPGFEWDPGSRRREPHVILAADVTH